MIVPTDLPASYRSPTTATRIMLIADSFGRLLGRPLVSPAIDQVIALWEAPEVIVAHDTAPDPRFFFANRAALARFGMAAADFIGMPSRLSAELPERDERAALLARVTRDGFISDYSGIRIAADGRRFRIEQAVVWNLVDVTGAVHGQAATFEHWIDL